jgi:hypothetical protein
VVARDTEIIADKPPFSLTNSKWTIGVKYHLGSKASPSSFHFSRQVKNGRTSWAWQGKLHKVRSNTVNMELGGGKFFPFVVDETCVFVPLPMSSVRELDVHANTCLKLSKHNRGSPLTAAMSIRFQSRDDTSSTMLCSRKRT